MNAPIGSDHNDSDRVSSDLKAVSEGDNKITEEKPDTAVCQDPQAGPNEIERYKLGEGHLHASGQRWNHGADTGNELGDDQRHPATLVE